jgi:hypothetical protein
VVQIDDAVQGQSEQIILTRVSWGQHGATPAGGVLVIESDLGPERQRKTQEIHHDRPAMLQIEYGDAPISESSQRDRDSSQMRK